MIALLAYADLAHLVERRLAKAKVAGSSPVIRSIKNKDTMWCPLFFTAPLTGRRPARTEGSQRASMRQHTWLFVATQQTVSSPELFAHIIWWEKLCELAGKYYVLANEVTAKAVK